MSLGSCYCAIINLWVFTIVPDTAFKEKIELSDRIWSKEKCYNFNGCANQKKKYISRIKLSTMNFKYTLILALIGSSLKAQYTNYYKVDVNTRVSGEITHNVNSTNTSTIKTIDYGQLALANATAERNRLASRKYSDQRSREIVMNISDNPVNSFNHGKKMTFVKRGGNISKALLGVAISQGSLPTKLLKQRGIRSANASMVQLHESLFLLSGMEMENLSYKDVLTQYQYIFPINPPKAAEEFEYYKNITDSEVEAKKLLGEVETEAEALGGAYLHKHEVKLCKVSGVDGHVGISYFEDDYRYVIKENYYAVDSRGIVYSFGARFSIDKDSGTFEDLEGRRYYLRRLTRKTAASGLLVWDMTL